jgi:hypothetical protein
MLRSQLRMNGKVPIRLEQASSDDTELIRVELAAILADEHFISSKRYPAFLSHVVQKTLDGKTDELKERSIGIDVFKRKPDFDTSSDTVVRFTAGEVRKRLSSIYLEKPPRSGIQIELPLGTYIPEFFHVLDGAEPVGAGDSLALEVAVPATDAVSTGEMLQRRFARKLLVIGVLIGILVLVCAIGLWQFTKTTSVDRFWQPVRSSASPALVSAGAFVFSGSSPTGRLPAEKTDIYPYVSMATTGSIAMLTQQFGRSHIEYLLQSSASTTLTDMRGHPTVLVGAYDNSWTLRLLNDLRFRFAPQSSTQIYDSKKPSVSWSRPAAMPAYKDADDYAIVARFRDPLTENTVVVLAGIGQNGTAAATQFVTSTRYLDQLNRADSKGWETKNVEIVLKTTVVDGKAGPPAIVAVDLW